MQAVSEIMIPHRGDPLSPEEASAAIAEALNLVHILIGGGYLKEDRPSWLIARAHRFFSVQCLPGHRDWGCGCDDCEADRIEHFIEELEQS